MTGPQVTLFDWAGEPLAHEPATYTSTAGYWRTVGEMRVYDPMHHISTGAASATRPPALILPQPAPKPKPRRRVLLTQGSTRPHIDTGLYYGEPRNEAP